MYNAPKQEKNAATYPAFRNPAFYIEIGDYQDNPKNQWLNCPM
jgi:hypothetical protein